MLWMKNFLRLGKPAAVRETADRDTPESARDLTPEEIDGIIADANSGDPRRQCRLAADLLEKNADIMQAFATRKNAVLGCPWHLQPGDGSDAAKNAAETLEAELRQCGDGDDADTFDDLLEDLIGALLPGFTVEEILWQPGGSIGGFNHIEQVRFTFADGYFPRLVTRDEPLGMEMPRQRIIFHKVRLHGGDPARGGLIRPLAWLHCFKHVGEKDLLGFIERHGMPFIAAMVDEAAFNTEKNAVKRLIRNFGSSGGGIFTKNVELKLLECGSTGEVYFRLLEYLDAAVQKVILGQTASSGDSSGLSKGDAQSKVRQDILEADCRTLQRVIDSQLIKPWMRYNFGEGVPLPHLVIDCAPPEDKEKLAGMVKTLHDAGFEADAEEVGKLVGLKLKPAAETPPEESDASDRSDGSDMADTLNLKNKYDTMGVAIRAGLLTATPEIEAQTRAELGLPAMSPEVKKAWEATGGIRQPMTLKNAEAAAVTEALDVDDGPLGAEQETRGDILARIAALARDESLSDEDFKKQLLCLASEDGDAALEDFETVIQNVIAAGIAAGRKHTRRMMKK
jgi:phage gp29-like protein